MTTSAGRAARAVCVFLAVGLLAACDRSPQPNALFVRFAQNDLRALDDSINDSIRRGSFTRLNTGRNDYRIELPGFDRDVSLSIELNERLLVFLLGSAQVRLNRLRFDEGRFRWNAARQAIVFELDLEDKLDGIIADVTILGIRDRKELAVSSGRFSCYLAPRIGMGGQLDFEPVEVEIDVNTDDAIPAVRNELRDALREVEREVADQLDDQFRAYETDLSNWIRSRLAPGAQLRSVYISDSDAVFEADPAAIPEDLTGDGRVDIADLVTVARDFGKIGFSSGDVNQDGRVDIIDLVMIARRFGQ